MKTQLFSCIVLGIIRINNLFFPQNILEYYIFSYFCKNILIIQRNIQTGTNVIYTITIIAFENNWYGKSYNIKLFVIFDIEYESLKAFIFFHTKSGLIRTHSTLSYEFKRISIFGSISFLQIIYEGHFANV